MLKRTVTRGWNKSRFSSWNDDKIQGSNGYHDVEEEYGDLFNRLGGKSDVLKSINSSNFIDLDGQEGEIEISDNEDDSDEGDDMNTPEMNFFRRMLMTHWRIIGTEFFISYRKKLIEAKFAARNLFNVCK
ncbi:BAM_G0007770.mRNA.1.CDS.1 [Saccharomyces cerevisiae]|nr:BAM_G0007770.mRNA.1.CDS.1 [Saccharomyces cerevisiae]CAI7062388.1 BAM_G0007770.mRNA.1.CDS.1 [Saccharomyces cerevisiae]